MTTVIHTDSCYTLTAHSMTHMTSQAQMLLVNFVSNSDFGFSLNGNRQDNIKLVNRQSTRFGV